jgi:arsenate reductase
MWGYGKCGTCRNAQKWMIQNAAQYEWLEIIEDPPSGAELRQIWQQSGLPLQKFFNTSGERYRELDLKNKLQHMNEEEQIQLLSTNGKLIKRPLCTDGERVTVGFKESQFTEIWGNSDGSA